MKNLRYQILCSQSDNFGHFHGVWIWIRIRFVNPDPYPGLSVFLFVAQGSTPTFFSL
jgi:hypothetical protein